MRRDEMKQTTVSVMVGAAVVIMLGFTGCGGGRYQNAAPAAPSISLLRYTPRKLPVNTVTDIYWRFDFSDRGGDVATATYTVFDPNGVQVSSNTMKLGIPAGIKGGTQSGTTKDVKFSTVGIYTATIYVTDRNGATSNNLSATFTVIP